MLRAQILTDEAQPKRRIDRARPSFMPRARCVLARPRPLPVFGQGRRQPLAIYKLALWKNAIHCSCGEGSLLVLEMSLSRELNNVMLSHPCSRCGSERQNPGVWFRAIRHYTCVECGGLEVLTYDEKLTLFAKAQSMRSKAAGN
jgi:hypothetical protein